MICTVGIIQYITIAPNYLTCIRMQVPFSEPYFRLITQHMIERGIRE